MLPHAAGGARWLAETLPDATRWGVTEPSISGRVLSGTGGIWRVRTSDGRTVEAGIRGRLKKSEAGLRDDGSRRRDTVQSAANKLKLAVGDEVTIESDDGGAFSISEIAPRRSQLARREPGGGHGERIVAANVDQVVIVFAAAKPDPHPRMLDRFLVIAEANGLAARIVVNKVDLTGEADARHRFADYVAAGYPLHCTSVKTGAGLAELGEAIAGRTSALSGPSGVGKSSLLNAMYPGLDLRVGEISESVNKGRHTTVGALLHPLPGDAFVVDTPGLREVGMWALDPAHLDECFPELRGRAGDCRFGDCTHRQEPDCAVLGAVNSGAVSVARFDSYLKLRAELEDEQRKWAPHR